MNLRPYQQEFNDSARQCWSEGITKPLGVAATGSGKTIMASELMFNEPGNCLFLADAQELVHQNADKYNTFAKAQGRMEMAGVEMGKDSARIGVDRVVVATSQSLFRRLDRYPEDYFNQVIIDEAHRNTLGQMSKTVLEHFSYANQLGVTATPFRSDRLELGDYYEKISCEIGLDRLIREGFLSRIMIRSVPMHVDLSQVGSSGGDYSREDLGVAIEPILKEAAAQLVEHASDRKKIVVFLPLIKTSMRMCRILNEMGIEAVHVSGEDKSDMKKFTHGSARVICNAQLLTTGWDCPHVDCVLVLRPTKSLALYSQMVGRGTRICDGKENLLLLDPLYMTDDHRLINPARLVARDAEQAKAMTEHLAEEGGGDLLTMEEDVEEQRAEALRQRAQANARKKPRMVDAVEFAMNSDDMETAEFKAEFGWEQDRPSKAQLDALAKADIDTSDITTRGQASKLLDLLVTRRRQGLATPKQLRFMKQHGHKSPATATFEEASHFVESRMKRWKKSGDHDRGTAGHLPTPMLIKLRAAGLKAKDYKTESEAKIALENLEPEKIF